MKASKPYSPLFWFYIICCYVVFQLIWWGVLVYRINNESVHHFSSGANYSADLRAIGLSAINAKKDKRIKMILGEGLVFLSILGYGIYMVRRSFKREAHNSHMQQNFLMSVTHELKTPIASARLQLETLEKRQLNEEQKKTIIHNAIRDTDRLQNLVDNILMASKFENHAIQTNLESIDLTKFLNDLIQDFKSGLGNTHQWKVNIAENAVVVSDRLMLHTIFINLLDNARKYSPAKTTITINLQKYDDSFRIQFVDEGMGILDNNKDAIFQKFYRVENEYMRQSKGSGLGLYITTQLCELLLIDITVKDNAPKGSIFELVIKIP
jgi:K+-sensing histidine kinase KdpD